MSNYGHNEAAVRLAALAGDAQVALDSVARGEADAIEGWLAYGAALNEGRALFAGDKEFGKWVAESCLSNLDVHPGEQQAAMWAAANADQLAEAKAACKARTLRGWHDQWKKIEQEREAARKKAEREAEEARKREAARQEAEAQAKAEQEARRVAAAATTEGERKEAEAKAEQAAAAKAEAEKIAAEPEEPEQPEEDPETAKVMRELAKLTPEGVAQLVIELRTALADERAKRRAAEAKVSDLKEQIAVFEADHDMGAKLSHALGEIRKANGRLKETQTQLARETRRANFLEKDRDDLRKKLENQVIPL